MPEFKVLYVILYINILIILLLIKHLLNSLCLLESFPLEIGNFSLLAYMFPFNSFKLSNFIKGFMHYYFKDKKTIGKRGHFPRISKLTANV